MKIFILGGTGSIGSALVNLLIQQNHQVFALARSDEACEKLSNAGATPVEGNLRDPDHWVGACDGVDAVVHAAAEWGVEMAIIDRQVVDAILGRLRLSDSSKAFIYTGGCWLYGQTGDVVATEESVFDPLPRFAWSIPLITQILVADYIRGMVVHPAMVYERDGGVFEHILEDANQLGYVRVVGSESVRWPLIHHDDLASIYSLMLERGEPGDVYNAATNHGVEIGQVTRAIAGRLGISSDPVVCETKTAMAEMGVWAEGYAIDQQMSGAKARSKLGWRPVYEDVFSAIA